MKKLKLSIIIISYNTCNMTLDCLESLLNETEEKNLEVIVLDNNSDDGSSEAIEKKFPTIKLIKSKINLGFAEGNNYCAKIANGEFLLLLNPDTITLDRAVDKLLLFSSKYPSAGIWGGRTLFYDKSLNPSSCWGKMTIWNLFCRASGLTGLFKNNFFLNSEAYGGWLRDSDRNVDIVSGCFFLVKNALWKELKGFDKKFFMYGEEADFCLRAKKIGYQPMVTGKAVIIHYGGASEKNKAEKMIKLLRAKVELITTHWNKHIAPLGKLLLLLWPLTRVVAFGFISFFLKDKRVNRDMWKEVWKKKNLWINGY